MSLDTWCHQGPTSQAAVPHSPSTLMGAELPQAKKVLCLCVHGSFPCPTFCDPVGCGLLEFSVMEGEVLQARVPELEYWPILVAISF